MWKILDRIGIIYRNFPWIKGGKTNEIIQKMCFVIFVGAWGYNWFTEIPDQLSTTKDINTSGGGGSQK